MKATAGMLFLLMISPLSGRSVLAQSTELQWRVLAHVQSVSDQGSGFAGWVIFPNVLGQPSSKSLVLLGIVETWDRRWLELLGGVLLIEGRIEPVVDMRFSKNDLEPFDLFLEIQHNVSTHTFYLNPIVAVPLEVADVGIKAGLELDWFLEADSEELFYGPRISIGLPVFEGVARNIQITAAYKLRKTNADIFRMYFLLNF